LYPAARQFAGERRAAVKPGAAGYEPPADPIQVVDKSALNAQLAQSYVTELMDRARLA
jgi:hypothetical protein